MERLPFLTADLPGVGGRIKERVEDFLVEEQPLYRPCGEGEHVYLFVEKRGLATSQLVHALAKHFGVKRAAVGVAGMKDKSAITRQVISIHTPGRTFTDFPMIENDRISVLWADMHTNKLRLGHLRGNRFSIRVRGLDASAVTRAWEVLRRLRFRGAPNFAGEQRFGCRRNNHRLGRAMILQDWRGVLDELLGPDEAFPHLNAEARRLYARGEFSAALDAYPVACRHERVALHALEQGGSAKRAVRAIDFTQRRFWFTSLQSWIFNRCLADRIERREFDRFVEGDVAVRLDNGALFEVDAPTLANPALAERLARFEVSPTGPIWGTEMMRAAGAVAERESAALAEAGLTEADLDEAVRQLGRSMSGGRRAYRVPLIDPEVEGGVDEHGPFVRCAFELPPGAFATVVMREVMKTSDPPSPTDDRP